MKKVLILGASGMAGHVLYTLLKDEPQLEILGTSYNTPPGFHTVKLNVFDTEELTALLNSYQPEVVVNCIGMLIKESRTNPDKTIYVNAYFPHLLKKLVNQVNARLIHISTDCVFSGKTGGYLENSPKDATDIYGLSKSLGEISDEQNLTIRTSIIGPELKNTGEGLFHWFMSNKRGDTVNGFKSNFWSGVTTLELAKFIRHILVNNTALTGLYHLTNNQKISKYDLLQTFNKVYNKGIHIISDKDYVCDKSFINTRQDIAGFAGVPDYEGMIGEQHAFMVSHEAFYQQYFN